MKKVCKRCICIMLTFILFLSGLGYITNLTQVKSTSISDLTYKSYFENPAEYDVLFLGTSHVMFGVYPMELWRDYGITSYNWGSPTCTIPSVYWKLMNLLEYTTPKLVVVDCFRASWVDKVYDMERMHEAFDPFPLSVTKIKTVMDLMDDEQKFGDKDKGEILFRLSAYHTRWEELGESDFKNSTVDKKGAEFQTDVEKPITISHTEKKKTVTQDMEGVNYLKKLLEECRQREIPVLLTYLPYPTSEEWKMEANMIQDIADEYGVNYLNFTDLDVVDYNTDCSNEDSHLNPSGGRKVTKYLGDYIYTHYDIPCHQGDVENVTEWQERYDVYIDYKIALLKEEKVLKDYLMLLNDNDLRSEIYINPNSKLFQDEEIKRLINNIENGSCINDENLDAEIMITVRNRYKNAIVDKVQFVKEEDYVKQDMDF